MNQIGRFNIRKQMSIHKYWFYIVFFFIALFMHLYRLGVFLRAFT